ncbi:twin-arginine translocation signal domain-containing protein [uncultured Adlercreutzia sp.]
MTLSKLSRRDFLKGAGAPAATMPTPR